MIKINFTRSCYDCCVYFKKHESIVIAYLLLYVDDILLASKSMSEINAIKVVLRTEFDMKELRL